jgi:LTXXQ motif family protein
MINLPCRTVFSAVLLITLPAGIAFAEAPGPRERPSADMIARLQDGRIAMAKAALRLSDSQAKLWAPLEEQIRASLAERAKVGQEREQVWREGATGQNLAERFEQASQRMMQRAERMKSFSAAFKNLYVTLSDEQKPHARLVLRAMGREHHHRRG